MWILLIWLEHCILFCYRCIVSVFIYLVVLKIKNSWFLVLLSMRFHHDSRHLMSEQTAAWITAVHSSVTKTESKRELLLLSFRVYGCHLYLQINGVHLRNLHIQKKCISGKVYVLQSHIISLHLGGKLSSLAGGSHYHKIYEYMV